MNLGTVMGVRAHPDDETYLAAGLFAHAVDLGSRVVDVTATRGEGPRQEPLDIVLVRDLVGQSQPCDFGGHRVDVPGPRPQSTSRTPCPPPDEWGRGVGATQPRRLRAATYLCFMYWSHQQTSARSSPLPSGAMRPAR